MEQIEPAKNAFQEVSPAEKGSPFYRGLSYLIPKRTVDILCSFVALVCLSPVFLVTAVAIRLESKGSVFFLQERVGQSKRVFKMYKFRSMRADAPKLHQVLKEQYGDCLLYTSLAWLASAGCCRRPPSPENQTAGRPAAKWSCQCCRNPCCRP